MIHVVDAPTGQGKTNAAINYINVHDGRYLFVTPYKTELVRIKESCSAKEFYEPEAEYTKSTKVMTKKNGIKKLFKEKKNIVTTHALFKLFDKEMIEFCKNYDYTLILDEVTDVAEIYDDLKPDDLKILIKDFVTVDNCMLKWREDKADYNGNRFLREKGLCEMDCLYYYGDITMLWQFSVSIFNAFKESFILTYMFRGQLQKYYYDFHKLEYDRWYVKGNDMSSYELTPVKQSYGNVSKYKSLIEIIDSDRMNSIGDEYYSLSNTWYTCRDKKDGNWDVDEEVVERTRKARRETVRKKLATFYKHYAKGGSELALWTCFIDDRKFLKGKGYVKGFLSCNAKATNMYRSKRNLAYVINTFMNPVIKQFFEGNDIPVDGDMYALSSLVQWVWRSAVRDGKKITLYLPSVRMRNLFIRWLNDEIDLEWD